MNLLQLIFSPKHFTPKVDAEEKKALEEYSEDMNLKRGIAQSERDRTARIAAYLRCTEERRDDCRVDISWEELAQQGYPRG